MSNLVISPNEKYLVVYNEEVLSVSRRDVENMTEDYSKLIDNKINQICVSDNKELVYIDDGNELIQKAILFYTVNFILILTIIKILFGSFQHKLKITSGCVKKFTWYPTILNHYIIYQNMINFIYFQIITFMNGISLPENQSEAYL
ncbi:hypothetical protein GLOIN_2v378434 [Rhizophagus irregularis DAOM 181602=DAOM 197198]|uniref:Uncharacterized protein n=1 Tax=Rhizophagus irregularis (strain DAOM 181602 / DAOM 197198 / MUCL 43194) TaxID=747089 RepID=A0A2P4PL06_RHIID|nr:hypothetical protein GLOIN_2v378434 [Rhizophagus irregularis DAOM 181602=DAOM 197198]POG66072.1 hypothetical protein GLOIN_2v378434 [Rhizophagus irregularis DAOM 181602=DAOM 197198]|eukprot:XP_025172938.1 hypothetical protein GLOIN_2v378434 [Rhizophagus irregularis DAOM 181602=DAOM 197198]